MSSEAPRNTGTGEGEPSSTAWEQIINEELYRYYQATGKEIKYVPKMHPPVYIPQRELNEPPKKTYKQAPKSPYAPGRHPIEQYPTRELYPRGFGPFDPGPHNYGGPGDPRGPHSGGPDPRGPDPRGPR